MVKYISGVTCSQFIFFVLHLNVIYDWQNIEKIVRYKERLVSSCNTCLFPCGLVDLLDTAYDGLVDVYMSSCFLSGDTLYFRFTSDGSGTDWGYKFTVWASQRNGFDTGYLILNRILLSQSAL